MPKRFNWTPELIEEVRCLYWDETKSPSEIVTILRLPLTYRAVIGMFHRKGIPVRDWHQALYLRPKRAISDETKRKLSLALKGKPLTRKGWHPTEEHIRRIKMYRPSREARLAMSMASKADWLNPEHRDKRIRILQRLIHAKPNQVEQKVLKAIDEYGLPYVYNGAYCHLLIQGRCPDFINANGEKAVIEVFGDYWHKRTKDYFQTEVGRQELFNSLGFRLLVLWGSHIKEASVETLAKEIANFSSSR